MPEAKMDIHKQTARCDQAMEMRLQWRDVDLDQRSWDVEFSIYGRGGYALVAGVAQFNYMGRPLYQYDDDWIAIIRNTRRARKVWVFLGNILEWEGSDTPGFGNVLSGRGESGYVVNLGVVGWEGGGCTGGNSGSVQVYGNTPVPIR